jgi:hypothetical protein
MQPTVALLGAPLDYLEVIDSLTSPGDNPRRSPEAEVIDHGVSVSNHH